MSPIPKPTPYTDEQAWHIIHNDRAVIEVVPAQFARKMERTLARSLARHAELQTRANRLFAAFIGTFAVVGLLLFFALFGDGCLRRAGVEHSGIHATTTAIDAAKGGAK
jgi:hypothetical protein